MLTRFVPSVILERVSSVTSAERENPDGSNNSWGETCVRKAEDVGDSRRILLISVISETVRAKLIPRAAVNPMYKCNLVTLRLYTFAGMSGELHGSRINGRDRVPNDNASLRAGGKI